MTGNEAWIFGYDAEMERQSSQWIWKPSPRPKTARQVRLNLRVMLIIFFGYEGVVGPQFVPKGQRVNTVFYLDVTFARIDKEEGARIMEAKAMDAPQRQTSLLVRNNMGTIVTPQPP